jgi:hypothetical protein
VPSDADRLQPLTTILGMPRPPVRLARPRLFRTPSCGAGSRGHDSELGKTHSGGRVAGAFGPARLFRCPLFGSEARRADDPELLLAGCGVAGRHSEEQHRLAVDRSHSPDRVLLVGFALRRALADDENPVGQLADAVIDRSSGDLLPSYWQGYFSHPSLSR